MSNQPTSLTQIRIDRFAKRLFDAGITSEQMALIRDILVEMGFIEEPA